MEFLGGVVFAILIAWFFYWRAGKDLAQRMSALDDQVDRLERQINVPGRFIEGFVIAQGSSDRIIYDEAGRFEGVTWAASAQVGRTRQGAKFEGEVKRKEEDSA